jgi:alpha-tubulin suppressor-like RCC1 family protein
MCEIMWNDIVKCWGDNTVGQLGNGMSYEGRGDSLDEIGDNMLTVSLANNKKIKFIASPTMVSCAILEDNLVYCWLQNSEGLLGIGDSSFNAPWETTMQHVDLGGYVKQLSLGASHACAILFDDQMKCWGLVFGSMLASGEDSFIGDNDGEMGHNLPAVALGPGRIYCT